MRKTRRDIGHAAEGRATRGVEMQDCEEVGLKCKPVVQLTAGSMTRGRRRGKIQSSKEQDRTATESGVTDGR